ncbi:MAG TPA: PKD domain-containing protein, partial [Bacteroidia bacterium]|nr:PKD domain-containing protein [Bacteroidia bacterium]
VSAGVNGGHPPYTFLWSPSGGTGSTANGLPAGVYTITCKDSLGCTSTATDTIKQPPAISLVLSETNITCNGACNGSVFATASGGAAPYNYSWSGGCSVSTCRNICPGMYVLSVTDSHGCTSRDSIRVSEPAPMKISPFTSGAHCNRSDGFDSVSVSGAVPPYTYSWSPGPGSSGPAYHNLAAGVYTVSVRDANNCLATDTLVVSNTSGVNTSVLSAHNVTCFGGHDGSAIGQQGGGVPPYSISWSPSGGVTDTAKNLIAGTYVFTVSDSKGCKSQSSVTILQPSQVIAVPKNTSICYGQCTPLPCTGVGGTPAYNYSWTLAGIKVNSPVCPLVTTTYTVTVTDSNGCVSPPQTATVTVGPPLEILAGQASICAGETAALSSTPSGGNGNYSYTWYPATGLSSTTIQNPVASPVISTTYTVVLSDNCGTTTDSALVLVHVNPAPVILFTANDTSGCVPLCVNFQPQVTPACATASWTFGDGTTVSGCQTVTHCYKNPGSFGVTLNVKDVNGCSGMLSKPNYIHTYPVPKAAFSASPQPTDIFNPQVYFTDLSTGASSWLWNFGDLSGATSVLENPSYVYPSDSACYNVTLVVKNGFGCSDSTVHPICIQPVFTFYAPNAFTPNGDGINDSWMPKGTGIDYKNYSLLMFDRWGNLMFETHVWGEGWDGRANNGANIAQIDTYVWKVNLKDFQGYKHAYSGICNLIR